ncbi:hypothetical protein LCGC14_1763680 [marine sediment metagenome]|uniref:Uncharacterized protein n=1 Tax=marine sediment metagenome TaxID=412755 RepID=A0A0F9JZY4_9ZZZZ
MLNISEIIFLKHLEIMKSVLDLGEYGLRDDTKAYLYFKKQVMNSFYNGLRKVFQELEREGVLKRCKCESNLRHGYTKCTDCHGAGYENATRIAPDSESDKK